MKCESCRYWHDKRGYREPEGELEGECRRYPPVVMPCTGVVPWESVAVESNADYWCGEYEVRNDD